MQTNRQTQQELIAFLKQLESVYHVNFVYQKGLLDGKTVDASVVRQSEGLEGALERILSPYQLSYKKLKGEATYTILPVRHRKMTFSPAKLPGVSDSNSYFLSHQARLKDLVQHNGITSLAAALLVSGKVIDQNAQAVPGVSVLLKGTAIGVVTDLKGNYSISVPEEKSEGILVFSSIGYVSEEMSIQKRTTLNVTLLPDVKSLGEVMVVGYGSQKKEDIIGSVSTVKGKDINMKSMPTFDAALQGLAAGVSVQSQSGAPGAPSVIKIRGTNSINLSTDPLWIVDGIPVFSNPWGLGSSGLNPMSLINPGDIESIEVLKDAAATAVYGSRGSNGVILVTTRKGKKGDGNLSLNYSSGLSTLTRTPAQVGYVDTQGWFSVMDQAYQNSSNRDFDMADYYRFAPQAFTQLTRPQAMATATDWYKELFHTGSFSDYNLSSSNAFEKGSLYISGNYRSDKGVQRNNNLERTSVRSNLEFSPLKNLTLGLRLNLAYANNDQRNSGITSLVTYALPWLPVRNPDNELQYFNPYSGANPAALSDPANTKNNVQQYRGLGAVSLEYRLPVLAGLALRTELSTDLMQSNIVLWQSRDIRLDGGQNPSSYGREEAVTSKVVNYNAYASFERVFAKHSINVVGGVESTRMSQYSRSLSGQDLTGVYQELGNPTVMLSMSGRLNGERYLLGYFGRANYKFLNRYLFGISARRDGSSVFTSANRWGNFLGLSAGWILSEEEFMSFLGSGMFVKLRGSYGGVGNQNIPSGLNVINYYSNAVYGSREILGVNGTTPVNLPAADLRWETTQSMDIGIDFGLLRNRINGSVAYYHRLVKNMLLQAPAPVSAGVSSTNLSFEQGTYDQTSNAVWANIGDMVNSGYEFELHSVNINRGGFEWNTSVNISFNRNIIQRLTPSADRTGKGLVGVASVSRTGYRRSEWFVADWAGVDPRTGVPMIYALDTKTYEATGATQRLKTESGGDSLIYATRTNIRANRFYQQGKSADPRYYGGITNTFRYKGFDLSFLLAFSGGNYILDYDRQLAAVPSETRTVLKELQANSWQRPGDVAKYPQLRTRGTFIIDGRPVADFGDADVFHNRELYKGDFIRLRNVQLGYTLSPAITGKMKMQSVRIYLAGYNLWTGSKYPGFDPEGASLVYYSNAIPQVKSVTFGADVKF
jgi:TonB-linked SusC/RagA family outer membrane protein